MTTRDPRLAALLDQLLPPAREARDWPALVAEAESGAPVQRLPRRRRRGRRLAVGGALVALAVLAPLAALAVGQGWWFLSAYTPKPSGRPVSTIASGHWDGVAWSLTSFRTGTGALCYAVTVETLMPQPGNSVEACDPTGTPALTLVRNTGLPPAALKRRKQKTPKRAQARPLPEPFPDYVVGTAPGSATEVDVAGPRVPLQRIRTIAAPASLRDDIRFFIARRPASDDVSSLTARDATGAASTLSVESPYRLAHYGLSSPGRKLPLSHAAIHELRLRHRSPDIYLLASRDGTNVYRLGTKGRCYGSGRAANLSWTPPKRVLGIVGVIGCGQPLSPTHPISDDSLWGQEKGQKTMTLYQLSGVASNEVAAIDLVDADGAVVARVPIVDSVYTISPVPAGIVDLDPVNAGGVWISRCGYGKGAYLVAGCDQQ